jgi:alpha-beta hydrolase superfamily lysophospholipase
MARAEQGWMTRDGLRLHAVSWTPEAPPKGAIGLVHGIGEHIGRYEHVAARMNLAGYAMLGFDLRGHGLSAGRRGDAPSYETLMDDIELLVQAARTGYARLPIFLYGHSMGGNLVINYALRRHPELAAVVVTGPGLKPTSVGSQLKYWSARVLGFAAPTLLVSNEVDPKFLSRDAEVVRKYMTDPLVHDRVSIRLGLGLVDAGRWALRRAGDFDRPLLLLQGGADRIVDIRTNVEFGQGAGGRCRFKLWPALYHELHNEPEKEDVFVEIVDWLDRHVS